MLFTAVAVQRNAACKLCGVALNEKSLLAYQYLCKDDKKAFAHAVASCYHDVLDSVRKQLATYFHLAEADSILTPPFLFT